MRASCHPPSAAAPDEAPYAAAAALAEAKACLVFARSLADERERSQRELQRRGEERPRRVRSAPYEESWVLNSRQSVNELESILTILESYKDTPNAYYAR